jgi:type II secretory pathway pseudopilin PulG
MQRTRRIPRKGIALLEALVALVILTTAGATAVTMAGEAARDIQRARRAEGAMREANAFFDAVSLWSRDDLDRHLGNRHQGAWLMRVDRPAPTLYIATLTDTTSHIEILRTSLFRPETPHVVP